MPAEGALIGLSPVVAYEGAHFSASPSVLGRNLECEQSSKSFAYLCMQDVCLLNMLGDVCDVN